MEQSKGKPLQTAAEIAALQRMRIQHPWNENSDVTVTPVSMAAGLQRVIVSIARVPPGKESFVYHSHECDEEFLYILSGRGRAEIDGVIHEVGPGDFMGFPAPGPAHHLTNPYEDDLVYLMGGERSKLEVGYFPKLGRRIVFASGPAGISGVKDGDLTPMDFADFVKPVAQSV